MNYLEIGRAGRDGLPSKCHLFYSIADFEIIKHFALEIKQEAYREHSIRMMAKVQHFLTASTCRRRILLKYFENDPDTEEMTENEELEAQAHIAKEANKDCCDNCNIHSINSKYSAISNQECNQLRDFSEDAEKLFEVIKLLNEKYGLTVAILFLIGSV
jgi:superfamily II DNA helicase RecQ